MAIDDLRDKKILILGLAREGRDTLNFLRRKFQFLLLEESLQ